MIQLILVLPFIVFVICIVRDKDTCILYVMYRIRKGGIYLLQENEKICEPERCAHVIEDVT